MTEVFKLLKSHGLEKSSLREALWCNNLSPTCLNSCQLTLKCPDEQSLHCPGLERLFLFSLTLRNPQNFEIISGI